MTFKDRRILVQYSGGKDSTACIIKLLEEGAYVETVHFIHKYAYELPTIEAKKICKEFDVKIWIVDITEQIENLFLSRFDQRPCRFCKGIMDRLTVEIALEGKFEYICVGDTASDTALVQRLKSYDASNLLCNRYFNKTVELPEQLSIIRPLIEYKNEDVFEFLNQHSVEVRRNNDTGDKYFEYSREGCPLQFKDYGVEYSRGLMEALKRANTACSDYATKQGIKASIHMPSEMIVTIPKGHEDQCRQYLMKNGIGLKKKYKAISLYKRYFFSVEIYLELFDGNKLIDLFSRFLERISQRVEFTKVDNDKLVVKSSNTEINARIVNNEVKLVGDICMLQHINKETIDSLFVELFHTYNYQVLEVNDHIHIENQNKLTSILNSRCISQKNSRDQVIRSSSLDYISDLDIKYLATNKVVTVIDLRNEKRCNERIINKLNAEGISYYHVPFIGNSSADYEKSDSSEYIASSYMSLLEEQENIREIFETMIKSVGGVLFFCKYGRDRTGIISIILNLLIGKTREEIILDYVSSNLFLNAEKYEYKTYEYSADVPIEFIGKFIETYQSAHGYLTRIGMSEEQIEKVICKMGGKNDERLVD